MNRRSILALAAAGCTVSSARAGIDHLPLSVAFKGTPRFQAIVNKAVANNWRALPVGRSRGAAPGEVIARGPDGLVVACGADDGGGALRLVEVQPAGGRRMAAAAYAAGRGIEPGARFGAGATGG